MNQQGLKKVQGRFLHVQILSIWSTLAINVAKMAKIQEKKSNFGFKKLNSAHFHHCLRFLTRKWHVMNRKCLINSFNVPIMAYSNHQ